MKSLFRRDRIWPGIIIVTLGGNLALGVTLMRVANADPHFAVEPDYYRRAVGWDSTQAQAQASAERGWRVHPSLGAVTGEPLPLTLVVTDADGVPLDGVEVTVEGRAVAHATEVFNASLLPTDNIGAYRAMMPIGRTGIWELRLRLRRGDALVVQQLRLELSDHADATVVHHIPGAADPARVAAGMRRE